MNKLHVYTGEGKGKTTAAMGLALRSLGHGRRVLIAQFLKDGGSGEIAMLAGFERASVVIVPVTGFTFQMTPQQLERTRREQTEHARSLSQRIKAWGPQLIVLDELCVALAGGMVDEQTGRALVEAALAVGETVATGRDAPAWLTDRADYVTRMQAQKHPFDTEGLAAREGIEW